MTTFEPLDSGPCHAMPAFPPSCACRMRARPRSISALLGIPFDGGVTNRAGTRHGPARDPQPVGPDAPRPPCHRPVALRPGAHRRLRRRAGRSLRPDAHAGPDLRPLCGGAQGRRAAAVAGGDHLVSLPILRGLVAGGRSASSVRCPFRHLRHLLQRQRFNHGTPFRRAIEEGLVDPRRHVQIGLRGAISDAANYDFAKANGIRMIFMEEFIARGIDDLMPRRAPCRRHADLRHLRHRLHRPLAGTPAPARRRSAAS